MLGHRALVPSILCAVFAACAGGETPLPSPELADDIAAAYAGGPRALAVSVGGAAGALSGAGGRSEGGSSNTGGQATGGQGGEALGGAAAGGSSGGPAAAGGRAAASGSAGAA